jgi:corticosteroid 11-beta-dehydrogenase isozyme 1
MGARILITSRTEADLKKVVENCKKEGTQNGVYLYHVADMADPDSAAQLIKVAENQLGSIDYLVLNHIKVVPLGAWMSTAENLTLVESVLNVNFMAYVRLASYAMPALRKSNGSLVVVSSVTGKVPQPYLLPYCASKFALDGFFTGLRQELNILKIDVSVTLCYVGLTNTEKGMEILRQFGGERIVQAVSPASPGDVAYAIVRGGALRQRAVYYPYSYARPATLAYNFIPTVIEDIMAVLYVRD